MDKDRSEERVMTPFRELPLSNDFIFGRVMRNLTVCRLFLEALLKAKIARIEIVSSRYQYDITDSYFSHGIRIDVYMADEAGTVYCVEMQTTVGTFLFWRIRFYQSAMDRNHLQKGEDYTHLPETFIIFICTKDLFGYGLPVYRRKTVLEDCENAKYDDGTHVYFLNSDYSAENADREDPAIMEFLRCIRENDTEKAHYATPLMQEICMVMEDIRDDPVLEASYMQWQAKLMDRERAGREEGRKEGREEGREEGIRAMVRTLQGFSLSRDRAAQSLENAFSLDQETAREKVDRYWQ